ncbi:hypothetical protein FGD77_17275 [Roseovarius sp. M141]|nr:hypothetical protein [Roseovarius sp. M141]
MRGWIPTTYKTKNWSGYILAPKQRGSLSIWFNDEMGREAQPCGKRGRQQDYSDAAMHACLTIKVLFGLPLRQTTWFMDTNRIVGRSAASQIASALAASFF